MSKDFKEKFQNYKKFWKDNGFVINGLVFVFICIIFMIVMIGMSMQHDAQKHKEYEYKEMRKRYSNALIQKKRASSMLAEESSRAIIREQEKKKFASRQSLLSQKLKNKSYTTSSKTYSRSYDEYNVNDYSDADEFYDDHQDDFIDYEEAEDYYNSHKTTKSNKYK